MHFNDLHLLSIPYSFTGVQISQVYRYIVYIGIWLEYYEMLKFKVLYLQNYLFACYETYRDYLTSDRELKY